MAKGRFSYCCVPLASASSEPFDFFADHSVRFGEFVHDGREWWAVDSVWHDEGITYLGVKRQAPYTQGGPKL